MPKKLNLEQHKSIEELEKLYRLASDPIERTRSQIIWLLAKGYTAQEVALVTGYRQTHLEIRQKYPDSEVEIWAMDEQTLEDSLTLRYRLGLKPILRRMWVPDLLQKYLLHSCRERGKG